MDNERDGPKFEVGDRVKLRWRCSGGKYLGRIVAYTQDGRQYASLDDYKDGSGLNGSYPIGGEITATLISPTTEPVAAQKETKMKAYGWVIWSVEDDARTAMADQSEKMMPFKSAENAKLWAWQQFAKAGEDPDCFEVEVHPFGG